ncbi:hypothetical protein PCC7424_1258 [Gloeothece citriformis PCC 7424]|uniref:General secretion pathway protein H n=1 Tax=Gloeothece citriformis (strain PCC 7424) TaxID=65393 RepID=B7K7D7_GLOC7|nr:type IV pilin-like G/H family protein [Gloeothece citriformis]ACK69705.1 hypothetical protein PCC7424_1258 [Gloeothece citriformis PCC 7424]
MKIYFKVAKLLPLLFNSKTTQGFTPIGFVVRVFLYSGVLVTLLFPSLNDINSHYKRNSGEKQAKTKLQDLHEIQQKHRRQQGTFAYSLNHLPNSKHLLTSPSYTFSILSPMIPSTDSNTLNHSSPSVQSVITIAQPLSAYSNNLRIYIGATFFDEKSNTIQTAICKMNQVNTFPQTVPTLEKNQTLKCPPDSTLVR